MLDINGASAIVTGGASGLGAATARLLSKNGAKVCVVDLNDDLGSSVAAEIGGKYAKADVSNEEQVQAAVDAASSMGPLRVLMNCAGLGSAARTVSRDGTPFDLKNFEFVIRVNLIGSFNCIRLAASAMSKVDPQTEGERGAIVNTASVAAFDGQIGQAAYSASKGGIVGMTLPIARDLARSGIRVLTIAPGIFETAMLKGMPPDIQESLGQQVPFPSRLGRAPEYAQLVKSIFSIAMLNGEVIRLDGAIRMAPK